MIHVKPLTESRDGYDDPEEDKGEKESKPASQPEVKKKEAAKITNKKKKAMLK